MGRFPLIKAWGEYFLRIAEVVSEKSRDKYTKVGCVVVGEDNGILSTGYNGIPRHCNDDVEERNERPEKYLWFEHAERNAIYHAAKNGIALEGASIFCTAPPCVDCARGIIQTGIVKVVYKRSNDFVDRADWKENMEKAETMLREAGVNVVPK
jgi:dCMP deaminase